MKKIILITISAITLSFLLIGTTYAASSFTPCKKDADCKTQGEKCINEQCADPLEYLLSRPTKGYEEQYPEAGNVANLPDVSLESGFKTAIKTILGAAMILTIIAIVVAAVYYILSQGSDEDISKAKNIIIYLIIGMVIMAAAYGIVTGVIQFDFFKAK